MNNLEQFLKENPNWKIIDNKLYREINLNNFKEVVLFFNLIAFLAEKLNHHPDLEVSYKKIIVKLFTHSNNSITDKDIELANLIEKNIS
ncbi:MAG: 4a-hydroxytetrahydrobiopterin dehydratase [bacterium]